jgi:hypothetical protein
MCVKVYFLLLVMLRSSPVLAVDLLVFNILWSVWIVVRSYLEERDLAIEFGDNYIRYQKKVPMLFPGNIFKGGVDSDNVTIHLYLAKSLSLFLESCFLLILWLVFVEGNPFIFVACLVHYHFQILEGF